MVARAIWFDSQETKFEFTIFCTKIVIIWWDILQDLIELLTHTQADQQAYEILTLVIRIGF
jgi:hypothetical protein